MTGGATSGGAAAGPSDATTGAEQAPQEGAAPIDTRLGEFPGAALEFFGRPTPAEVTGSLCDAVAGTLGAIRRVAWLWIV